MAIILRGQKVPDANCAAPRAPKGAIGGRVAVKCGPGARRSRRTQGRAPPWRRGNRHILVRKFFRKGHSPQLGSLAPSAYGTEDGTAARFARGRCIGADPIRSPAQDHLLDRSPRGNVLLGMAEGHSLTAYALGVSVPGAGRTGDQAYRLVRSQSWQDSSPRPSRRRRLAVSMAKGCQFPARSIP
jgi:hypothetical protein